MVQEILPQPFIGLGVDPVIFAQVDALAGKQRPQRFQDGVNGSVVRARNVGASGVEFDFVATGITYTVTGCPFAGAGDGIYSSNGVIPFPGLVIS